LVERVAHYKCTKKILTLSSTSKEKNAIMAKSLKKRLKNAKGVKKVSADRAVVGVRNLEIVSKIAYESK
jgi:hypothetical protein